jgi:heat-inducible transcriptional repressor
LKTWVISRLPHKSAGRIPSEDGFRYFVRRLIDTTSLSSAEQSHIEERFRALPVAMEQWMRFAATTLARTSHSASLVTPPRTETSRFKHVELVSIQGRLVLLVLVLHGGMVHQRMLNLAEPIPQARLTEIANQINALLADLLPNQVQLKSMQLPLLEREIVELLAEIMKRADTQPTRIVYRDGLSEIINSFPDDAAAQQALRVYEERAYLDMIMDEIPEPEVNEVRVIVAGDGQWHDLDRVSMVLSRYGVPGQIGGTLGVLGPTHINYGRAISSVRFVSSVMTNMLTDLYSSKPTEPTETEEDNPG